MDELQKLREEIDHIDSQIVSLFEQRMKAAEGVAEYKKKIGKAVLDTQREKEKIEKVSALAHTDFNRQGVEALFNQLMTISRMRQYMLMSSGWDGYSGFTCRAQTFTPETKVVYNGVPGAYGHQAMLGYFGSDVKAFHVATFKEAMEAIKNGEAQYGVLPVENSSTGIITDVYDLMGAYDNYIVGEYVVKVEHALLGVPGAKIQDIRTVYSHPQGLLQCRRFLGKHGEWKQMSTTNTAIAAKKVIDDGDLSQGAIASQAAAKFHGLCVLQSNINDIGNNSTRFIIFTKNREYVPKANQISICFELPHESGTLYNILSHFIFNGQNMNRIESRPIRGEIWQYRFFVDFDGNFRQKAVQNALTGVASEAKNLKILGNYIHAE